MASQLRLLSNSPGPFGPFRRSGTPRSRAVDRLGCSSSAPGSIRDSLRCFEAAATTLRFRAAAARVHLSPGALSDRIRRLEEGLGRGS